MIILSAAAVPGPRTSGTNARAGTACGPGLGTALNRLGQPGRWAYLLVDDPTALGTALNPHVAARWDAGQFSLELPASSEG
jgi:hypothetical protein